MTPELHEQVGRIYHEALGLATEDRSAFLDQACGGNEELRREVERLLAGNEQLGSFLAAPAAVVAAELLAEEKAAPVIGWKLGHYKILSPIGSGGMGIVFLAQDLAPRRAQAAPHLFHHGSQPRAPVRAGG
jgi:serine/threonine-protein kinase